VRLRTWSRVRTLLMWVGAFITAGLLSQFLRVSPWLLLTVFAIVWGIVQPVIRRKAPRGVRWVGHERDRFAPPPVSDAFELTVPCERCGALNAGVEAAEWRGDDGVFRVFRTCAPCGHTQWWVNENAPPRIRRWQHANAADRACAACGYSFAATPIVPVDREGNVIVSSRRCPECGRQEFFRRRDDADSPAR
jgi:hypothetical protein